MRNRLRFLPALLATLVLFQGGPADAGPEKVGPVLRAYTHPGQGFFDATRLDQVEGVAAATAADGGLRVLIQGDVSRADLAALGVRVRNKVGPVYTAVIPPDKLLAVSDLPGIVRIEAVQKMKPKNNVATVDCQVKPALWGSSFPPYSETAGAGVIVGVVDSGFDYTHDDFRNGPADSRFDSIWDQTVAGTPPSGYTGGNLFNAASLDNNTASTNDPDGHGTHVMGSAAGNGSGTAGALPIYTYTGMAPEATLIGVKTSFFTDDILDGVSYIFDRAATLGMPAVVNLSLGNQYGAHDGTDPFEVGLDALTGPGRVVVVSAGNEGDVPLHARGSIPTNGNPSSLDWVYVITPYASTPQAQNDVQAFVGYYDGADDYDITVTTPNGYTAGPFGMGGSPNVTTTNDGAVQIENGITTTTDGDVEFAIYFYDAFANRPPASGTWTITFDRNTSTGGYIDAWNYGGAGNSVGVFTTGVSYDVTLGIPGTANEVITAGAYTTTTSWSSTDGNSYQWQVCPCIYGSLADFSSRGPTRTGGMKPDITAPGFGVFSTLSDDVPLLPGQTLPLISPDDRHWILTGTSMSSPLTAGVVAMILENNPTFTPADVKARLHDWARTDGHTGGVWNNDWGYGKLSGKSADAEPPVVTVNAPNGGESFMAGATTDITWNATDNYAVDTIDIEYSTDGGSSWLPIAAGEPDDGTYSWTVPDVQAAAALVRVTATDDLANAADDVSDGSFTITSTIGVAETLIPNKLILGPAHPNPITSSRGADISFGLTREGPAALRIFNAAGRLVAEVPERSYPAGFHTISWDGRGSDGSRAVSGVYFYRLQTREGTISRKLMVIR